MRTGAGLILVLLAVAGCGSAPSDETGRATARWAIGVGGKVHLAGMSRELDRIDQLPETPFAIERLNLNETNITDQDLKNHDPARLKSLVYLGLHSSAVGDDCVDVIVRSKTITELELSNTGLTDAGLMNLIVMENLKKLYIYNNAVSKDAIDRFKKLLPECVVYH